MGEYEEFIARKRISAEPVGFDVPESQINPMLFPFQRDIVRWALHRGRAALFEDCGLGKSAQQLEWSRHVKEKTGGRILILAPLAVAAQTCREGVKFGIPVTHCLTGKDVVDGINITNYERLHHFNPNDFSGIVLDECFAPDTQVLLLVDGSLESCYIKDVRVGDLIPNASGEDVVHEVLRRRVQWALRVSIAGRQFINSPNHPYFTQRGWVCAQDLRPGDSVMETTSAMRLVRGDDHPSHITGGSQAVLRSILLSEMADESTGNHREGACARNSEKAGIEKTRVVPSWQREGRKGTRADATSQSDGRSGDQSESIAYLADDEAQTFRAWGQWDWFDATTTDLAECSWTRLDSGICFVTGPTKAGLSYRLQNRLSQSRIENRNRGGWAFSPQQEDARREKRRDVGFSRVDGIETLEPGHPDLERYREKDGYVYFYDITASRHPSFSLVGGLLVHNSGILKSFDGSTRKQITEFARPILYRLACTATPAPNDLIELTNHAEFLDIMNGKEIIALFFTQDGNTTHKWRLKGHAMEAFWTWLASWSCAVRAPSDLGYEDGSFILPQLSIEHVTTASKPIAGELFVMPAIGLANVRAAQRESLDDRVAACAALVNGSAEPWLVWCNLNAESEALRRAIPGSVEVRGSDSSDYKERMLLGFSDGSVRIMISKPSIAGHGMNWQHCHNVAFVGLSYSYEQFYQAIRRCWRFGQTQPVKCYVIASATEGAVVQAIEQKERQAEDMFKNIVSHMRGLQLDRQERDEMTYREDVATGDGWTLYLGDSVNRLNEIEDEKVGLTVTSVPFPGMYAYTNSAHDMGNVKSIDEMVNQFKFLIPELLRVTMPGRSCCIHLVQTVAFKGTDGYIGIKDFRGRIIAAMEDVGWIYYGEVAIEKDPQVKAIRTKDAGLLFKSLATDSARMHMALADYLIQFRKPGDNPSPIHAGISEKYQNQNGWITPDEWIEWASPVWWRAQPGRKGGISETDVLNVRVAREAADERHLCPLQLGVIERAIKLWSAPGDLILDPYNGVGSVGYVALRLGRKYVGCELKESYWATATRYLKQAENGTDQVGLFTNPAAAPSLVPRS